MKALLAKYFFYLAIKPLIFFRKVYKAIQYPSPVANQFSRTVTV